ncbi:MAG: trypsin-like peptidase domain-containing protein [Chloroflexi bacterium]|nr:trypsin-like peptidase domain-containing protein [Chloroflexota bacterium]
MDAGRSKRFWIAMGVAILLMALPSIACLGSSVANSNAASQQALSRSRQEQAQAQDQPTAAPTPKTIDDPPAKTDPVADKLPARTPTRTATAIPAPAPLPPNAAQSETMPIVRVAQVVRPAVVNITTQQLAYDWYMRPVPEQSGSGSGVIFDKSGLILTNNHVVEGAQGITVALPDGRTFDGQVVGTDARSDLAVVRINGQNLPVAELGDSDALQIGEQVVAIGNALALPGGPTVTSGIVGALSRSIREDNGAVLYDLIQTDAAINPGNSGGPLVNLRAQVIGINTAIANAPGGGIGFSIAINTAKPIAQQLVTQRRVIRPWLGVTFQNVTPSMAARYNLGVKKGVMVATIARGTPAAKAGLRRADIIVKFGEDPTDDDVAMLKALGKHRVGDTVPTVIVRDDKTLEISVTLEEMPAS